MFPLVGLALVVSAPVPKDPSSPWRADRLPTDMRADLLNEGFPLRWEKGTVHVLAWATVADNYSQSEGTLAIALKQFDRPTEDKGHHWALALLHHHPSDRKRPWEGPWRHFEPPGLGEPAPRLTSAMLFGHELYPDRPTDEQVRTFLGEAMWDLELHLGTRDTLLSNGETVKITRKLTAGGVDPVAWRKIFEREMPAGLFPELRKAEPKK